MKARGPLIDILGGIASSPRPLRVAFSRLQTFLYCLIVAQTQLDLYYFLNTLKLALEKILIFHKELGLSSASVYIVE